MFYLSFTSQSKGFSGLVQILHRQDGGGYRLYHYDPTTAGAVVIVLLFTTTTVFHVWQMLYTKCWIAIPLVLGGLCKLPGYCPDLHRWLTTYFSASGWVFCACSIRNRVPRLDSRALHHSSDFPPCRPSSFRRNSLYGIWKTCKNCGWRGTHRDPPQVDHENLCHRRSPFILTTRRR